MKIVIDTNVFISALITPKSNSAKILRLLERDEFNVLVSEEIILEILKVLSYSKIRKRHKLTSLEIKNLIDDYVAISKLVFPGKKLNIVKDDPSDNKFLECALAGRAGFIITGDVHLLKLKKFGKIQILNPRDFLNKIRGRQDNV
ncbi:MAG: putative toxin-antitoxin system toxin component, PIN family [Candidatus Moranbacteria bacterium RIFOXYA12_FULL_44_15]|nr:MAG: putative toxin-antitoxin system toxin component, PIN family [Candidatus Moranbacteria bacterium RIFOXYA12_FULL_44_15]OGI35053.1 MAG: putative toxin-antitoxin system toxin component, PIN family [Candidatus Moranbacteria bacterium RIFOXYA2_FULL_43_15]